MPVTAPISHPAVADPARVAPATNGSSGTNGQSNGAKAAVAVSTMKADTGELQTASVQQALGEMMGDAPLCETCGHITVRNGSCYRCLNCGASMGCS